MRQPDGGDNELKTISGNKRDDRPLCFHCGDICRGEHVEADDRDFCCRGCLTVYEMLRENGLCAYYDLESNPGISLKIKDFSDKYSYLDNPEIAGTVLDFQEGHRAIANLYIPAIHCSSCIWLLEHLYRLQPGVYQSRVNFAKKELFIEFNPGELGLRKVVELLTTIGYEPLISLENQEKKQRKETNKGLILRIGVAGFAFGNIMLLSFPEYFGFEGLDDVLLQRFLSYPNILLALPVVFYCSSYYYRSAWSGLKQGFVNIDVPITIGIMALFLRSLYEILFLAQPGYLDSLAGLLFFLLVGRWFQNHTYEGLSFDRDFRSYFPLAVHRIRESAREPVLVRDLQVGDEIFIRNMEIIPADSKLLSPAAGIDYSFVTGESERVAKVAGDYIYAGGRQIGEGIRLRIERPVSQSYLLQLWDNEVFSKEKDAGFRNLIDKISKYFTTIVLGLAVLGFVLWAGVDLTKAFLVLTAVLIVACPCALSMSGPFTLGTAIRLFGKKKFYLRGAHVLEKMVQIDHIVFDKTGTLTQQGGAEAVFEGTSLSLSELAAVRVLASNSTHPLSKLLSSDLAAYDYPYRLEDYRELPGQGLEARINGELWKLGSSTFTSSPNGADSLTSSVHINRAGEYRGRFVFRNEYRPGLSGVISDLAGKYRISMLTGDGEQERERLQECFPATSTLLFRQSPQDKLDYIKRLQENGERIAMIGDGLNDAGALRQSDVGISISDGTAHFSPASDGILDASGFGLLPTFMRFAHTSRRIVIAAFSISFIYNVGGISFALAGLLTPLLAAVLMPLSSISVVVFASLVTNLSARWKGLF